MIFMRFPGGKSKALTLSYDDGVEQDIRLVDIMKKHGLKGTFNLNSGLYAPEGTVYPQGQIHRRMSLKMTQDLFLDSDMEVAVHGYTHPFLEQLPADQCTWEVLQDRISLEKDFDRSASMRPGIRFRHDSDTVRKYLRIVAGRRQCNQILADNSSGSNRSRSKLPRRRGKCNCSEMKK